MQLILRVTGREAPGPVLRLPSGRYVLGRSPGCQILFHDQAVSRHHAALNVGPEGASVRDLGSRHGTRVNGCKTAGEQPLYDADRLCVAGTMFLVRLTGDESEPEPGCLTVPGEGQGQAVEISAPRGGQGALAASLSNPDRAVEEVGALVYIYGPEAWPAVNRPELEYALHGLLQGDGYVKTDEDRGCDWGIDLVLRAGADVGGWVGRLAVFLRDWQVPDGTALSVIEYPTPGGFKHQRIDVPGRADRCA